jgi:hypothetical protein
MGYLKHHPLYPPLLEGEGGEEELKEELMPLF